MAALNQHKIRWVRQNCCIVPAFVLLSLLPLVGQVNAPAAAASMHGTVRDSEGRPVAEASVSLKGNHSKWTASATTDSRGNYVFGSLEEGVYSLHAAKIGRGEAEIASVFLAARADKTVDVTLEISSASHASPPQFFDEPQFTVSGVTDTTALGGHGSDTIVRTRESIAKDTASLSKSPSAPSAESAALEKSLKDAVQSAPADFDANHRLGQLLMNEGRAREAIPYLERAAQKNPGNYENSYDLALANAEAGNNGRARSDARSLAASHPKAELYHLLGDVEEKLGDPLEAVREYQRAAEINPTEPYLFDWGSELLLHHAPEPAEAVFHKGSELFPKSVRMLIGLGAASFARGSYDQAIRHICAASDLAPNDPLPYQFLGKIQRAQTSTSNELIERLHRFVTLQPQNAEANYDYAVALWKQKRNAQDKAVASQIKSLLENAIRLEAKFSAAELQLGIVTAEQGDPSGAITHFRRASEIDPQNEEAHFRLAQVYRQTGQSGKAKEELQIYQQITEKTSQQIERERHEIRQFVYTLRDPASPQTR